MTENDEGLRQDVTWLTTSEMAERLKIHPVTLHRMAERGEIPCLRAGRVCRWPLEQVEKALMTNQTQEQKEGHDE